jgi:hypothetical protein
VSRVPVDAYPNRPLGETAEAGETETDDQWAERAIREHMAAFGAVLSLATTYLLASFARQMVDSRPWLADHARECIRALVAAEVRLRAEGVS